MFRPPKFIIKDTYKLIADKLRHGWEFKEADVVDDSIILENYDGQKFKVIIEYIGHKKGEDQFAE